MTPELEEKMAIALGLIDDLHPYLFCYNLTELLNGTGGIGHISYADPRLPALAERLHDLMAHDDEFNECVLRLCEEACEECTDEAVTEKASGHGAGGNGVGGEV